ncbi:MAG: GDSL-type esterase/lipase family protein [Clostridia bacterium]
MGIKQLETDIPLIIRALRKESPNAVIIFQNLYNPFKGIVMPSGTNTTFDMGALGDKYILKINETIKNAAEANNYTVVDIYSPFKNSTEKLVNVNFGGDEAFNYDPHPNKAGHIVIAEAVTNAIKELLKK